MTEDEQSNYKPTKAQLVVLKELAGVEWLPTTTSTWPGKYVAGTAAAALERRGFVANHSIPTVFSEDGRVLMVDILGVKITEAGRELLKRATFKIEPAEIESDKCEGCKQPIGDGSWLRVKGGQVWHVRCAPEDLRISKNPSHGGGMAGHDDD